MEHYYIIKTKDGEFVKTYAIHDFYEEVEVVEYPTKHGQRRSYKYIGVDVKIKKEEERKEPQPEMDLEKEIDHYLYGKNFVRKYDGVHVPGACMRDWKNPNVGKTLYGNELTQFARYFYKLGLKARSK